MKTGIATVSLAGNFAAKLEAAAAAGFDGIEIFEQDFLASDLSPRTVGQMVRDAGLEVMLFQPFRDFEGLPDPLRARAFKRARHKFALMNELGTDLMLICSSVHPQSQGGIDRSAQDLAELGAIADEYGVRVGYEALAWGRHVDDHRDAWEIVRRADHPNIGLILDSFHTLARGIDPESIRRIPGNKIFFVQLADAPAISMDLLYLSRHFRSMPGEGDFDVAAFLRAVLSTGYDGPLSLEVFNDQFRAGLPRLVALDGHRSLINLMDTVRRADPSLKGTFPDLPAPAVVHRVEFIEFVTSDTEARQIEKLLGSLGFGLTGQHVSKAVRRYQQGAVNILLNTEAAGYANAAYASHGTSVSEIALVVPDAGATFSRGRALLAETSGDGPKPGELSIPALRGVGGSLLRLLDDGTDLAQLWTVDFRPVAEPDVGAGLIGVDHIAQTMPFDEMLSWTQFYTALFDARKAPMVDVVDPEGLVRSQAIRSGALRVTLNGADARRTLSTRFLADSFGASTQHIAFACEDIFATAAKLAQSGFAVLSIGANYYDDLEARYDLPEGLAAAMRSANVLYDEDDTGRFFQLYSRPLDSGLFIEIVQRIDGYEGFGAPNAPFRIAAQARLKQDATMPKR